jgi:hypothetical protein
MRIPSAWRIERRVDLERVGGLEFSRTTAAELLVDLKGLEDDYHCALYSRMF